MHNKTQSSLKPCPECGGQRARTTLDISPLLGMEKNELLSMLELWLYCTLYTGTRKTER